MTTQTTYGECFLISACATIKELKHDCWHYDHLFNKDGSTKTNCRSATSPSPTSHIA